MTNCAVTTLPGGNDSATVTASAEAGLSPRHAAQQRAPVNATRRAACKRILRNNEVSHSAPFKA
jgi:hypothetical protein